MKKVYATAVCALLLQACASSSATQMSQHPDQATLEGYDWNLISAVNSAGQPVSAIQLGAETPLALSFSDEALSIRGGCNHQSGAYQYDQGSLSVSPLRATLMACSAELMKRDAEVAKRMEDPLQASIVEDSDQPVLTLTTASGDELTFSGEPTPETLYGSEGKTVFLEVAAETVPCSHPGIPDYQCLKVRERQYDDSGIKMPTEGDWQLLYQPIQGYEHQDGQSTVLRTKQYEWKNPPQDVSSTVYVLDMVVEQQVGSAEVD
uniref:META and DUF4377 domain-containing protein n=1 Tax=Halomonas sp. TaxID=1486246 RepID=UPI0026363133|nr:META and DUF4377 domain-containing protein [Halomonas sp.]